MSYAEQLYAAQQAGLDRAREQYLWRLGYEATEPWPGYDLDEDDTDEEEDQP